MDDNLCLLNTLANDFILPLKGHSKGEVMKLFSIVAFTAATLFSAISAASAHGGGLDSAGCHRDNRTGGYHCHR